LKHRTLVIFSIRQIRRSTGAARNVLEQAEYMQKMGCDVRICAERVDLLRLKQQGLQWFRVPRLPINSDYRRRFFDWFVKRYIAIIKPDLFTQVSHP
jgi:hypothetical protein